MTSFDSTKALFGDILREIQEGKFQFPDFQRGWVWDDDHIRDLLVSIARSFPVGMIMFVQTGGEVRFQARSIEGLEEKLAQDDEPEKPIPDGQQRLKTLAQALFLTDPIHRHAAKGVSALVHGESGWRVNIDHVHESGLSQTLRKARRESTGGAARQQLRKGLAQAYRILLTRGLKRVYL